LPKYDCIKYNWKVKHTISSFEKRKDKIFFEKLSKHSDPKNFLIANFANDPNQWIKEIAYGDKAKHYYEDWLKTSQSLSYILQNDIKKIDKPFDSLFIIKNDQHPELLKLYFQNEIKLHTLVVLVDLVKCFDMWNKKLKNDLIWQSIQQKIKKTTPFIDYDHNKIKKIIVDHFSSLI
jgi:hypothetical protein